MSTIKTDVRLTIRRMSPLIWAHAYGVIEGNRQARRKAAARSRKGIVSEPSASDLTDAIRATFTAAEAEVARNRRLAEHMERTREWQAVQALQGQIIDTLSPEERAARAADLPAVGSFHG